MFSSLLKLKADQEFVWREEHQKALDEIKHYLVKSPVLVPPQKHKPFKLYLSADERAIVSALIQEFEGKERAIYFVSRRLLDAETRYSPVESVTPQVSVPQIQSLYPFKLEIKMWGKLIHREGVK